MAIQTNVTQITHNHNGTGLNGPKLLQANTHESPDTDASTSALHHTIGTGALQAAAGNHLHTGVYTRIASNETITGKHTFPSGTNAIAIPDFQNSLHSHLTNDEGGPAVVNGAIQAKRSYSGSGISGYPGSITVNTTTDFYLHTNRFTVPANVALSGYASMSYYIGHNNSAAPHSSANTHRAFFYISYNQGESPAFSQTKNIILNGANFNGSTIHRAFAFSQSVQDYRDSFFVPFYLAPSTSERTNMALVMRVFNDSSVGMYEVNWGLNMVFSTQQFIAL